MGDSSKVPTLVPPCPLPTPLSSAPLAGRWGWVPWALLLGILVPALWLGWIRDLELDNDWNGWSPVGYIQAKQDAAQLDKRDFRTAIGQSGHLGNSLAMRSYDVAAALGIPPLAFQKFYILGTALLCAWALVIFARVWRRDDETRLPAWVFGFAALVLTTQIMDTQLGRFGGANLWMGQTYGAAIPLQLLALALALRGRLLAAGGVLALLACVHLSLGFQTAVVATSVALLRAGAWREGRTWLALALPGIAALAWLTMVIGPGSAETMDTATWVQWQRMTNFHFFPVDLELFTARHQEAATPLLALALLALAAPMLREADPRLRRAWLAALGASMALTLAGVLISLWPPSPAAVMLACQRASSMTVMLLLVPACHLFAQCVRRGDGPGILLSACCLAPPMLGMTAGIPLVPATALAVLTVARLGNPGPLAQRFALALGLLAVAAAWLFFLVGGGHAALGQPALLGASRLFVIALVLGCAWPLLRRLPHAADVCRWAAVCGLVALFACAVVGQWSVRTIPPEASAYQAAQRWAKDHTAPSAVFFVEPTLGYGSAWSEGSRRASFGSAREWLHTPLCYRADAAGFREGVRRLALLGVDSEQYRAAAYQRPVASPFSEYTRLLARTTEAYHDLDGAALIDLAHRECIDYFVFRTGENPLPVLAPVYENRHFRICRMVPFAALQDATTLLLPIGRLEPAVQAGSILPGSVYSASCGWLLYGIQGAMKVSSGDDLMTWAADADQPHGPACLLMRPGDPGGGTFPPPDARRRAVFSCRLQTAPGSAQPAEVRLRLDLAGPGGWRYAVGDRRVLVDGHGREVQVAATLGPDDVGLLPVVEWSPALPGTTLTVSRTTLYWLSEPPLLDQAAP